MLGGVGVEQYRRYIVLLNVVPHTLDVSCTTSHAARHKIEYTLGTGVNACKYLYFGVSQYGTCMFSVTYRCIILFNFFIIIIAIEIVTRAKTPDG